MPLVLTSMSSADYTDWMNIIVPEYAAEKVASGAWTQRESLEQSRSAITNLLPRGRNTQDHHLHTLTETATRSRIGFLWFGRRESHAFLYDLYVYPESRRQGYGRQALKLLEAAATARGYATIGLHVFAQNTGAAALYRAAGYAVTDLVMRKSLTDTA